MPYSGESDYKYVDGRDDVPVTGQGIGDDWTISEIDNAVEAGEQKLEADVNEGEVITNPQDIHGEAAATWATYKLVLGMKSPDAVTRGDSLDEGSERIQFADRILSMYQSLVQSIIQASGIEGGGDGAGGGTGIQVDDVDFFVANW